MIKLSPIDELDYELYKSLKLICYPKDEGYMQMYLNFCWDAFHKYKKEDFGCWIIHYEDNGIIMGWAIIQNLFYRINDEYYELNIFVSEDYRNKGIGTKLIEYIRDNFSDIHLTMWVSDKINKKLFRKMRNHNNFHFYDYNYYNKYGELKEIKL